jgi:hypothetical protein
MKNFFFLISIAFLLNSCGAGKSDAPQTKEPQKDTVAAKPHKKDERIFESLGDKTVLAKLFDDPEFDTSGTALWKPNYYERLAFPVSYDGKCHTKVDTVMYFTDQQNRKCAVMILATYKYSFDVTDSTPGIGDCHFCGVPLGIALFSQTEEKKWELYRFEKSFTSLGYFGTYRTGGKDAGKICLKEIGDPWTCLSLTQGVGGNMGEFSGSEDLYSIEQYHLGGFPDNTLTNIFSYNYHYESTSIDERTKEEEDAVMKIIKKKNNYYDIDLIITKNGKHSTEHYVYSDDYDRYIEK